MRERESQALGVHPFEGFSKGGFSLGALLGLLAGAAIFGTLVNVSGKFQTQGMFASSAACAVLLGGWRLRWGRFPYARALGVMALAALFSVWVLKRWPARVPPTPPRQVGPKMTIDGANFSIAKIKPQMTEREARAILGKPSYLRSRVETTFGMSVEMSQAHYERPKLVILYLEDKVYRLRGPSLELKGVKLFSEGDAFKRLAEMWGPPTKSESQPGRAVYSGWEPDFACNYEKGRIVDFELGYSLGGSAVPK